MLARAAASIAAFERTTDFLFAFAAAGGAGAAAVCAPTMIVPPGEVFSGGGVYHAPGVNS